MTITMDYSLAFKRKNRIKENLRLVGMVVSVMRNLI